MHMQRLVQDACRQLRLSARSVDCSVFLTKRFGHRAVNALPQPVEAKSWYSQCQLPKIEHPCLTHSWKYCQVPANSLPLATSFSR